MNLPDEIILFLYTFLPCSDSRNVALTSTKMYSLWKEHVLSNLSLTTNKTFYNRTKFHIGYCFCYRFSFQSSMIGPDTVEIIFANSNNDYYKLLFTDCKYEEQKNLFDYLRGENYVCCRRITF
jgi:hypothetical protein